MNLDIPLPLSVVYSRRIPWFGNGGVRFQNRDRLSFRPDLLFYKTKALSCDDGLKSLPVFIMTWVTPRSTFFLKPTIPLVPFVILGCRGECVPDHDMLPGAFACSVRVFPGSRVIQVSLGD